MATNEERAARLVRGIEASIVGDVSVIPELYADDVRGWAPAMEITGAIELAAEFEDRDDTFTDIELVAKPLDVGGDQAVVEWAATVTHSGALLVDDDVVIEASGARIVLEGVTVATFVDDKIVSFRQYWDEVSVLEQLALLPDD